MVTHSHLILEPGQRGQALADFFRLENGKVVEHWDAVQDVPEAIGELDPGAVGDARVAGRLGYHRCESADGGELLGPI